ncbi:hypothetical protein RQP46_007462 [Phenoliferia psychrophenolica]
MIKNSEGSSLSTETATATVTVQLTGDKAQGWIKGSVMSDPSGRAKAQRFLNVPYALPPVGPLRFKRPVPLGADYRYEVDGTQWGNICSQPSYLLNGVAEPLMEGIKYTEDCLHLNIWTPMGTPPTEGWPVIYWIHGGWLQVGNANHGSRMDPTDLIDDDGGLKCIIVANSHRLNLFGFLACKELRDESSDGSVGNYGFHDQRLGLVWTYENISAFNGNPANITLGGLSAGAYSSHFQLAHEFNFPVIPVIKRISMHSNAMAAQPKTVEESQLQFDQLLEHFGISLELTGSEKLEKLRAIPDQTLAADILKLKLHTFRAVTDGHFVHPETFFRIGGGHFASEFNRRGMSMVIGEVENEENLYREINHPHTSEELLLSLENYYPDKVIKAILPFYSIPPITPTPSLEEIKEAFGIITADGQVYASERLLVKALEDGGVPDSRLLRYRIKWRGSFMERFTPARMGVAHAHDTPLWWFTKRAGMSPRDEDVCRIWLAPYRLFIEGKQKEAAALWWTGKEAGGRPVRTLMPSGEVEIRDDDRWERCTPIAAALSAT